LGFSALDSFFDSAHMVDESLHELEVLPISRFLTIFCDDLEVTRAFVETTTYRGHDARVELNVMLEYVGENPQIINMFNHTWDYLRRYIFVPDGMGGWMHANVPGSVPFSGVAIYAITEQMLQP
jgi:hypothetical protein